jgi:hypothetical protein
MIRSRVTEEQILLALKQTAARQPVGHACRLRRISEATFYVWKERYCNVAFLDFLGTGQRPAASISRLILSVPAL